MYNFVHAQNKAQHNHCELVLYYVIQVKLVLQTIMKIPSICSVASRLCASDPADGLSVHRSAMAPGQQIPGNTREEQVLQTALPTA